MEMIPHLRAEHALRLAPQMQYALTLLQMDSTALLEHVQQQALENPLISLDHLSGPSSHASFHDDNSFEIPDRKDEYSLREDLYRQLPPQLNFRTEELLSQLIELLDSDGYLRISKAEVKEVLGVSDTSLEEALSLLQSLDPPGVGAGSLSECLILQLRRKRMDDPLLFRLAEHHLPDIAAGHLRKIAREESVSLRQVEMAVKHIQALSPYPAAGYSSRESPVYVTPDVIVTDADGGLCISLSKSAVPVLHREPLYMRLLDCREDPDLIKYLQEHTAALTRLEQALSMRSSTLLAVSNFIVKRQEPFFRGTGSLLPLSLRDISLELGLHISTISKAVQNKYLLCPRGLFPLRHFLCRYTANDEENPSHSIGQEQVCQAIRHLIASENPDNPLSDQQIFVLLKAKRLIHSRRSVAYYREKLGIPSSYVRKTASLK